MSLAISSIIQRFELSLVDPAYTLQVVQAITIKPTDLFIRARPREDALGIMPVLSSRPSDNHRDTVPFSVSVAPGSPAGQPLYVFYGSNTGTSEAFGQKLATEANSYGKSSVSLILDANLLILPK